MTKQGCADFRVRRFVVFLLVAALFVCTGVGAAAAQQQVSNAQDLQDVRDDLDGDYVMTDDISLLGEGNFDPIGDFNDPFTGTFDGNGHNITGLTIDRDDELDVGLFGAVGSGGEVRNVSVNNVDVSGRQWVGALVGTNQGEVRDSYATGDVVAANRTGGLVGTTTPSGKVIDSYAEGTVTAEFIAGGLVGKNEGDISRSYADVSVSGFSEVDAVDMGGLVGVNGGEVTESYARGEVLADEFLGGLVGASDGEITRSYATAEVVGDENAGGLIGQNGGDASSFTGRDGDDGTLRDSYWDTGTTNQNEAIGKEGGDDADEFEGGDSIVEGDVSGLTTSEMTGSDATNNMQGFDFTNTWATVTDPGDYPVLAWQIEDDTTSAPANFDVTIDSTNSPVTEGESLTVDVTVTNTGDQQGTQTASLTVGGVERDSATVALAGGDDSTTETLEWATSSGDAGSYTATVSSDDSSDSTSVTVQQSGTGGGGLSPDNPFGDSNDDPLDRRTVINKVVEWNNNGEIDGTSYTRRQIIDFVVEWNTAS